MNTFSESFWNEREWLRHVNWRARAARVSPYTALAATLARISLIVPPRVAVENPATPEEVSQAAPLNIFVAIVGTSGSGKGSANRLAKALVQGVGNAEITQPASGEGLPAIYVKREALKTDEGKGTKLAYRKHAALLDIPEVEYLGGAKRRLGSTLVPTLTSAWSGEQLGAHNKSEGERLLVGAMVYRLSVILGVQPGNIRTVRDEAITGLPQRFLWVSTIDKEAPHNLPTVPPQYKGELDLSAMRQLFAAIEEQATADGENTQEQAITTPQLVAGYEAFRLRLVTFPERVRQELQQARWRALRGEVEPDHEQQQQVRLAALFALIEGRLEATQSDWDLAGRLMDYSRGVYNATIEANRRAEAENGALAALENDQKRVLSATRTMLGQYRKKYGGKDQTGSGIIRLAGKYYTDALAALDYAKEQGYLECSHEEWREVTDAQGHPTQEFIHAKSLWTLTAIGEKWLDEKGKR